MHGILCHHLSMHPHQCIISDVQKILVSNQYQRSIFAVNCLLHKVLIQNIHIADFIFYFIFSNIFSI